MADPAGVQGVQGWIELLRSLGGSLFEVLRAEAEALGEDLRRSGSGLLRGLALLGAAAAVAFWTLAVLLLALIAVLAVWLPLWAAALIVAALFAGAAGSLAALGVRRLRQLETPAESVRRRVADHLDWWQHRLLAEPAAAASLTAGARGTRPPSPGSQAAPGAPSSPTSAAAPPRIHPDDPLEEDDL
jgi:hypothetical protein